MRPPPTGPFKPGDRILDKYEVRGLLGRGGHAFVYDCFNAFLNEEVAIKVIPDVATRGHQLFNRARGEAQFLYKADHPNVVRVMDAGETDGMPYIVMEKLEGMNLRELLRQLGPLTLVEALMIALQIASALEAAHKKGVIHRDLKPDNIFLCANNKVKVLDFGIAKFIEGAYQTTQRDLLQGTAPYMSPEQAQGLGVTFASDTFQLGTIIYEMIAGICPCMIGLEEPTQNVILAIQIGKLPPRLKSVVKGVPDYVDLLVWRAIMKEPQQRYASMADFAETIRAALARLHEDLPEKLLKMRVVAPPRKPVSPATNGANGAQLPALVARTTPIALATSTALRAASPVGPNDTEQMPAGGPPPSVSPRTETVLDAAAANERRSAPRIQQSAPPPAAVGAPAKRISQREARDAASVELAASRRRGATRRNDRAAARAILLRSALLGIALALPLGIGAGLIMRHRASAPMPAVAATREAPAPNTVAAAPISNAPAAPSPASALPEPGAAETTVPTPPAPVSGVASTPASSLKRPTAAAQVPPKSNKLLDVRSGLEADTPAPRKTSPTRSAQPGATKSAPAASEHQPPPKLIFE